ncbi:MAG: TonB-dependent receptor plug domain-containing protein [Ferruginibacter sp.]
MKLTAFILLIACLQVQAKGHAQGKITLTLKDAALKEALVSIQRVSNYRFIYNDDLLPRNAKVNLSATNASIEEVMNNVLQSTALTYKLLENNLIVISADERDNNYQVNITGTVSLRKDGETILQKGISVQEKGTDNITITDEGGRFTLAVQKTDAVLQVSYVGFKTAEVALNGRTTLDVVLEADVKEMEGVVVTALGITRQKRTLTYSAQTLGGTDISNTREANISSAMNGKVAGLTISKTNSGPGSSNRIIFRGNRSITGNNQPLIVVDGVRIDNTPQAFNDVSYNVGLARDNGDGISNLNPDDIESMTVLTGASASALYGSDASNGVVIITTKKGRAGKGIGVQVSSSVMFETPMLYPKFQNSYGQGQGGVFNKSGDLSWGPAMTGQQVEDWTGKTQALTAQPDNFKDFFVTGKEFINTVALSAGTD